LFGAWIATHLAKIPSHNSGAANALLGVLAAVVGGLATNAVLHGRNDYFAFLACMAVALIFAVVVIALTRVAASHRRDDQIS
jgi:uncharacterized membrane protein YeaQ/YmgE (transglycosylase-associated protein family)